MRENVATIILSKDYRTFPPRAYLTVEAAHTGLAEDTIELRLLRVLATDVADVRLVIVGDEARLISRHRATSLCAYTHTHTYIPHSTQMLIVTGTHIYTSTHQSIPIT